MSWETESSKLNFLEVIEVDNLKKGRWKIDFGGPFMDPEEDFEDSVGVSNNQAGKKVFVEGIVQSSMLYIIGTHCYKNKYIQL